LHSPPRLRALRPRLLHRPPPRRLAASPSPEARASSPHVGATFRSSPSEQKLGSHPWQAKRLQPATRLPPCPSRACRSADFSPLALILTKRTEVHTPACSRHP